MFRLCLNSVMPRRCAFCATRCQATEPGICEGCMGELPWQANLFMPAPAPLEVTAAALHYAFPVDAALKLLKFHRRLDYVPAFSELLWRLFADMPADIDALLPVPLHWRRHAARGFNQAAELCGELEKKSGLEMLRGFRRTRATPSQSGLDARARQQNLQNAFACGRRIGAQHVLIVDDVITTGATCSQLARVCIAAGAGKVSALAVART